MHTAVADDAYAYIKRSNVKVMGSLSALSKVNSNLWWFHRSTHLQYTNAFLGGSASCHLKMTLTLSLTLSTSVWVCISTNRIVRSPVRKTCTRRDVLKSVAEERGKGQISRSHCTAESMLRALLTAHYTRNTSYDAQCLWQWGRQDLCWGGTQYRESRRAKAGVEFLGRGCKSHLTTRGPGKRCKLNHSGRRKLICAQFNFGLQMTTGDGDFHRCVSSLSTFFLYSRRASRDAMVFDLTDRRGSH